MISRLLRQRDTDERGVTLVEVVITILVLGIVTTIAFDFLDRSSRIAARTDSQGRVEDDTQRVLRTVTQHLRGAQPLGGPCTQDGQSPTLQITSSPYDFCVQFTVPRTTKGLDTCARTDFLIGVAGNGNDRQLVMNRREHTGTTAACTTGAWHYRRLLLDRVRNVGSSKPVFTFYASNGAAIAGNNTAAIQKAASVKVNLLVRFRLGTNPIEMSSVAALRNNISR